MSDRSSESRRFDKGGFSNAEIPAGFERSRSPQVDAPLTDRGKLIYYGILAAVIVGGVILLVLSAR